MNALAWLICITYAYVLWIDRRYLWNDSPTRRPMWYFGANALKFRVSKGILLVVAVVLLSVAYGPLTMIAVISPVMLAGLLTSMYFYNQEVAIGKKYISEALRRDNPSMPLAEIEKEADQQARTIVTDIGRTRPYEHV